MAEPGTRPHVEVRLQGDGFVLRAWHAGDLESLLVHADDPQVPRGLSDRFPHPYTRADGEAFLGGRVVELDGPLLAIEIDGQACGSIAARPGAGERAHAAELGYWLGRRHWGQGLMTRVVGTYLGWVVPTLALQRVEASVLDGNPASARVLEKNGFQEEGVRRGAILKPDGLRDLRLFARLWTH
ncbi:GNAT family N-acetyltransferase [Pseudoxanthomonas daejeonensis]|uniref:GNAT family N-acetyltransferase n=1 Tax=Pseudoxanthomonas daejeonensis TaxID=266062 RepID=A0ABQ6Z881_9GAMM|nr:GNAT family protein [Pseudoxanthomonas daejeonensis]KAF1695405.1 GNAT family N-acetyltransferase [Pseudoxanthomonas daejeonensis]